MSMNNISSSIENACINYYRYYWTLGHLHSVAIIAECIGICIGMCIGMIEREEKMHAMCKFIVVAKVGSKDLDTYLMH